MFARTTMAELDPVRMSVDDAVKVFKESVIPALHEQEGYEGSYVLVSPTGKALVLTFWASEEAAEEGVQNGFYNEQVSKFVTIYRAGPGREIYELVLAEAPALTIG
jgi:heme-degrading monooxygenase HmoA